MVRTYLLSFDEADHAVRFVHRLHLAFHGDVSTFRNGLDVIVLDATGREGTREYVMQLAKASSASMVRVKPDQE